MRIAYDDDATLFAADIGGELRFFGYWEQLESIPDVLAALEAQMPNFPNYARDLLKSGRIDEALRFFFFDPKTPGKPSPNGQALIDKLLADPIGGRPSIEAAIFEAAGRLQEQDFNCHAPLNVLAGLSVLYQLFVMPRRNFEAAQERIQKILGVQLQIVGNSGESVFGPKEYSDEVFEETQFWELFDTVVTEFDLSGINVPNLITDQSTTPISFSPQSMVGLQGRHIAGQLINDIAKDRPKA